MRVITDILKKDHARNYVFIDVIPDLVRSGNTLNLSRPSGRKSGGAIHLYNNDSEMIQKTITDKGYKPVFMYRLPSLSPRDREISDKIVDDLVVYYNSDTEKCIHIVSYDSETVDNVIAHVIQNYGPPGQSYFITDSGETTGVKGVKSTSMSGMLKVNSVTAEDILSVKHKADEKMVYLTIGNRHSLEKIIPVATKCAGAGHHIIQLLEDSVESCVSRYRDVLCDEKVTTLVLVSQNEKESDRQKWRTLLKIMGINYMFVWLIQKEVHEDLEYSKKFVCPEKRDDVQTAII